MGGKPFAKPLEENFARNNLSADIFQAAISKNVSPILLFVFQEETEFISAECKNLMKCLNGIYDGKLFGEGIDLRSAMKEMRNKVVKGLYM